MKNIVRLVAIAAGIGGGGRRGTVVEPCTAFDRAAFRPTATQSGTESLGISTNQDFTIEIRSLYVSRILIRNALLSIVR